METRISTGQNFYKILAIIDLPIRNKENVLTGKCILKVFIITYRYSIMINSLSV